MLVDTGGRKVTSFKPTKNDLATAYVDTVDEKGGCLFSLGTGRI
jgi:N-acetylglucosamine kinase-like BadF-type ATPase